MMMIPPDHIMLLSVLERKRARTGCEVCTGVYWFARRKKETDYRAQASESEDSSRRWYRSSLWTYRAANAFKPSMIIGAVASESRCKLSCHRFRAQQRRRAAPRR